jgi:hypothetical protein
MLMTVWAWAEAAKPSAEAPMRSDLSFMNVWCVCVLVYGRVNTESTPPTQLAKVKGASKGVQSFDVTIL